MGSADDSVRSVPLWERFAAWLVTGPVGHRVAVVADLAVLFWRLGVRRARGS
jgi:hypothetical protein